MKKISQLTTILGFSLSSYCIGVPAVHHQVVSSGVSHSGSTSTTTGNPGTTSIMNSTQHSVVTPTPVQHTIMAVSPATVGSLPGTAPVGLTDL